MLKFLVVIFDEWEEAHYFQFCVIEKELIFVNMYGKIDLNYCNSHTHIHHNCNRYDKLRCNRYNKKHFGNSINKNNPYCGVGDDSETMLCAVGEPNKRTYHRWQLAHIKNEGDICAYFEEELGIQQVNTYQGVNSTKPVRINGTRVTPLNRFRSETLGHLPESLKLKKLVFDAAISLKFIFIKMKSDLQSNANIEKYQTFLSHISQLGIQYIAEKQVYMDKYKAKRYQELLMLVAMKHPQIDYCNKCGLVFIVNHYCIGEICSYTLNCINAPSITIPNVRLGIRLDEIFDISTQLWTENNSTQSCLNRILLKLMVLLRFDVSSNKSSTVDVLLIQAFMVFGSNLNDFLFLLLPHLMQLIESQDGVHLLKYVLKH